MFWVSIEVGLNRMIWVVLVVECSVCSVISMLVVLLLMMVRLYWWEVLVVVM